MPEWCCLIPLDYIQSKKGICEDWGKEGSSQKNVDMRRSNHDFQAMNGNSKAVFTLIHQQLMSCSHMGNKIIKELKTQDRVRGDQEQ